MLFFIKYVDFVDYFYKFQVLNQNPYNNGGLC